MKSIHILTRPWLLAAVFVPALHLQAQQFSRVTSGPMVNTPADSRSVNWVDANGDGYVDCMITNGPTAGQNNFLWLNDGAGNFYLLQNDPIVNDGEPSDGATWADADNDGDADAFVVNWYGVDNLYYVNQGNAAFTQPQGLILSSDNGYSETASWGDYDNDGFVDLYVTNSAGTKKNYLYRNTGGSGFTKVTSGALVNDAFESRCVNWTDVDLDGDLDLFVTNEGDEDENLYRNDGSGQFTSLSAGALLNDEGNTMSSSWGDIDNDGDLDVFLANTTGFNAVFRNMGNFVFTKLASDTTANTMGSSLSSAWSDVDNDADLDLFVTNAFNSSHRWQNYLYLNDGAGHFTRLGAGEPLTQDTAWSYGCAFADYDNDGFEDLAVATTRFAGQDAPDLLYHNNGNANHWITVSLEGTMSNRSAIGAKVYLTAYIGADTVTQMREVSAQSSYCGQNDLRVHFGLGAAPVIMSMEIDWPSGLEELIGNFPIDTFLHIVEGQGITGRATETPDQDEAFALFPNPTTSTATLQCMSGGFSPGTTVSVTDLQGRVVMRRSPAPGSASIELNAGPESPWLAGLYLVQISGQLGTQVLRLLVR